VNIVPADELPLIASPISPRAIVLDDPAGTPSVGLMNLSQLEIPCRYSSLGNTFHAQRLTAVTTMAMSTIGWLWATLIEVPYAMTIDQVMIEVTTLGAGSSVRLGLAEWQADSQEPMTVIVDAGLVDTSTTGAKIASFAAIERAAGQHLMGLAVCQAGTPPSIRANSSGAGGSNSSSILASGNTFTLDVTGTPGAFPATVIAGSSSAMARIAIRTQAVV
jgi:hypothetical protein